MTLDELKHVFRFQLEPADPEVLPATTLTYELIHGRSRLDLTHDAKDLETLLPKLEGYFLDAYRDAKPVFLKPEDDL